MKKYLIFVLVLIIALLAAGCRQPLGNSDQGSPEPGDTVVPPEPQGETVELTLYFANSEYIQTGNADLEKLLVEERQVTLTNKSAAETAVEELIKGPGDEEMAVVIPPRIKLIDVEVAEGTAYVNFSGSGMNGGSLEESLLVGSVIMTLTGLENIDAVQFLVDGQKTESLMGHIYTMEPIYRSDVEPEFQQ